MYLITQQFSEIQPKSVRDNCSNLILFKTAGCSFDKVYSDMVREVMENKKSLKYYVREFVEINMLVYI